MIDTKIEQIGGCVLLLLGGLGFALSQEPGIRYPAVVLAGIGFMSVLALSLHQIIKAIRAKQGAEREDSEPGHATDG